MTFFIVVLVVFLWVNLGLVYAELKLRVYEKHEDDAAPAWLVFFFWPMTVLEDEDTTPFIEDLSAPAYRALMALIWPIGVIWQLFISLLTTLIFLVTFIAGLIVYSFAWPLRKKYNFLTPKELVRKLYEKLVLKEE